MNAFKLAALPGTIATAVTVIVSGWLTVAAGAILTDPPSAYTREAGYNPKVTTRFVQTVEATPQVKETVMVVARRHNPRG